MRTPRCRFQCRFVPIAAVCLSLTSPTSAQQTQTPARALIDPPPRDREIVMQRVPDMLLARRNTRLGELLAWQSTLRRFDGQQPSIGEVSSYYRGTLANYQQWQPSRVQQEVGKLLLMGMSEAAGKYHASGLFDYAAGHLMVTSKELDNRLREDLLLQRSQFHVLAFRNPGIANALGHLVLTGNPEMGDLRAAWNADPATIDLAPAGGSASLEHLTDELVGSTVALARNPKQSKAAAELKARAAEYARLAGVLKAVSKAETNDLRHGLTAQERTRLLEDIKNAATIARNLGTALNLNRADQQQLDRGMQAVELAATLALGTLTPMGTLAAYSTLATVLFGPQSGNDSMAAVQSQLAGISTQLRDLQQQVDALHRDMIGSFETIRADLADIREQLAQQEKAIRGDLGYIRIELKNLISNKIADDWSLFEGSIQRYAAAQQKPATVKQVIEESVQSSFDRLLNHIKVSGGFVGRQDKSGAQDCFTNKVATLASKTLDDIDSAADELSRSLRSPTYDLQVYLCRWVGRCHSSTCKRAQRFTDRLADWPSTREGDCSARRRDGEPGVDGPSRVRGLLSLRAGRVHPQKQRRTECNNERTP